jgi:hypothetical protein
MPGNFTRGVYSVKWHRVSKEIVSKEIVSKEIKEMKHG